MKPIEVLKQGLLKLHTQIQERKVHPTNLPDAGSDDPITKAEKAVSDALDDLEATGILQSLNRMNISELLNPAAETHDIFEVTDEDIYEAVMGAREFRERSAGSDELDADEEPVEPGPTRTEALQAALVLGKYLKELDDPYARKLESALAPFGKMTRFMDSEMRRGMKDMKVTDFFEPKH